MATLVFSTVGTMLGGPVGGTIGALIGQSIDAQLLGPSGPKMGDLKVQGSDYGAPIPRIYGRMRVAGSVIWATDLQPSAEMSGAKGQSGAVTSYSVSFAVALSSRQVGSVGRIWADGKLLRGADGDFKVTTAFRFHDGTEDQLADPLIASVEGLESTPAYRGTALAVFEGLELAEYGNRIPFLTFELIADDEAPAIGAILDDASGGAVQSAEAATIIGYAAYGSSIRAALAPLIESHDIPLFDDGEQLREAASGPRLAGDADLGCSAGNEAAARIERELAPARSLPASLRLTYYDPERDFQSGEARASAGEQGGAEERREFAGALEAGPAKSLAHQMVARRWARRDKLRLRLPPRFIDIEPGCRIDLPLSPSAWTAERVAIEGFVTVVDLQPVWNPTLDLLADPGRSLPSPDIVAAPMTIAVVEPSSDPSGETSSGSTVMLAASSPSPGCRRQSVMLGVGESEIRCAAAARKSVLGFAEDALPAGQSAVRDDRYTVTVALVDPGQWLESRDAPAISSGENLAMLGSEMIQYSSVEPLGGGRFRLGGLMRGRGGSEWAMDGHQSGEAFVLLDAASLTKVNLAPSARGAVAVAHGEGPGIQPSSSPILVGGEQQRPLSPVRLSATLAANGTLDISWVRRSRGGFFWVDEADAPLGEPLEAYRVTITGTQSTIIREFGEPMASISAADVAALGGGPASVAVQQIGESGISRPTSLDITLS